MVIRKKFNTEQIKDIENALTAGNRVELIPVKDGIKIMNIKRTEIGSKAYRNFDKKDVTAEKR